MKIINYFGKRSIEGTPTDIDLSKFAKVNGCPNYIHKNKNNRSYLETVVIPNSLRSIALKLIYNSQ